MQELVKQDDDQRRDDELEDEEEADAGAQIFWLAVEARQHVDDRLAEGDEQGEHCARQRESSRAGRSQSKAMPCDVRFCAPLNSARSSFKLKSTSISCAPARSYMSMPLRRSACCNLHDGRTR